jgi:hypothetical protein
MCFISFYCILFALLANRPNASIVPYLPNNKHLITWVSQKEKRYTAYSIATYTQTTVSPRNILKRVANISYQNKTFIQTKRIFKPTKTPCDARKNRAQGRFDSLTNADKTTTYQRPSVGCLDSDNAKRIERVEKGDIFVF